MIDVIWDEDLKDWHFYCKVPWYKEKVIYEEKVYYESVNEENV